jgi:acetoin utilization protein AcuB
MMTIAKIMSSAPVVVEPKAPLREVYRVMAEHRIRHIPVVSTDGLVGVISDRDVREALRLWNLPPRWIGSRCGR